MSNSLEEEIASPEKVVRDLRHELAAANQREESLNETINSLRAQVEKSSMPNSILTSVIGIDVHQTTKSYNLFMSTSRSTDVKLCMQRTA